MASGYISVLFKDKDRMDVTKYRPITLLNVHYKILSKTLASRLSTVISSLCHPNQTGFIKGRYIMENIRSVIDAIDYGNFKNYLVELGQLMGGGSIC